jgi:hypothetical protein
MKKLCLLLGIVILPYFAGAESQSFDFGRFSFSLSPKILKDGSITDIGLGYMYTEKTDGQLRFRITNISKNEELPGVADSLNAITENIYEFFLLPIGYNFLKTESSRFWGGAGLYYDYDKLNEKGFFNMPELEGMDPPRERVNSYTNNFSMHLLGPLADAGISFTAEWFGISFSGGIVPIFFLHSSQKMSMIPLLDPHRAEHSQDTWGAPYFYLNFDSILLKYINLVFLYDFAKLKYRTIDFDDYLNRITPESTVTTQSFMIEASVLLPLGGNMFSRIGYGYTFDTIQLDSDAAVSGNRQYLILTVKKGK